MCVWVVCGIDSTCLPAANALGMIVPVSCLENGFSCRCLFFSLTVGTVNRWKLFFFSANPVRGLGLLYNTYGIM